LSIFRHFTGHTSTQALHVQQRRRSIFHSFCVFVTMMASVGQRRTQPPQKMQVSMSISMRPLLRGVRQGSFPRPGYTRVEGGEKRFLITVRVMAKTDISTSPCS
jgi:hypothetical protein